MAQGGQKSWSTFKQPHVLSTKARQRINPTWITKSFSIKKNACYHVYCQWYAVAVYQTQGPAFRISWASSGVTWPPPSE